jgi:hypothetical protein
MRMLIVMLLILSSNVFAAFDEDCLGKKKELKPFVESSEMILFSQMQNAYGDAIDVCRDVYARVGDETSFQQKIRKIENDCAKAYSGKNYDEKFVDLLRCKVTQLYNM